ncbi:hypothetical protein L873DRAFT_1510153 [Choiromyces venosus 120613-1]|uniref:Uncharacterized protein n=1 Tax=Choiromyces venosus 120613-1 TaxID=1336337 RepID=A0A3N4J8X9_9PEZI|nr:hypothetical protein L873DRAFT_1510153 [Choiromyces venosus 120613-1]
MLYRKISLLMNWPGLGLFRVSSTKKTKLLRIFEKKTYLAYHQFQKLRRFQIVLVQASSLKASFYCTVHYNFLVHFTRPIHNFWRRFLVTTEISLS